MCYADEIRKNKIRVGKRVREARTLRGYTQEDLVMMTGINPGYLSEVENGKRNPTIAKLTVIACALGVELHDLT